jgi:hypothetical protein
MEESNNKANSIKRWIEIITLVYFYLLICGITSEYLFYSFFSVNISEYLEITEIVFLLYDDLIRFLITIVFGVILITGIQQIISIPLIIISVIINVKDEIKKKEYKPIKWLNINSWYYQMAIIILSFTTLYLIDIQATSAICFTLGFGFKYILQYYRNTDVRQIGLTLSGVVLTGLIIMYPLSKGKNIKENTKEVTIIMNDNIEYNTGKELKYLGSIKSYTFLYNINDSLSTVLKRANINQLIISNK